jgi:drug/metabolite transporter (DMT)-like permease
MILLKLKEFKSSIMLLFAALIWGFAFVAQRVGIKYVGSFTFNGIRFALGSISLLPLIFYSNRKKAGSGVGFSDSSDPTMLTKPFRLPVIKAGGAAGLVLFIAATLQQLGLEETTAGKAAFITGFYIILVPVFGVFLKQRTSKSTWIAAVLAIIGLYLISVNGGTSISRGDLLELAGSFFWTLHILLIHSFTQRVDVLELSLIQYMACSVLSFGFAVLLEDISMAGITQALLPILYGGIASVGIAYTLQAYGQKHAKPSHASIILSLESLFAALGGFMILGEVMDIKGYIGCGLMLAGVIVSQTGATLKKTNQ